MKKFKLTLLSVVATLAMVGCSTPKYEPAELVKITPTLQVTEKWSEGISSSESFLVPSVYDDSVWVAGGDTLYRLNAMDGSQEWEVSFEDDISGGVGSDGYMTAVVLKNGVLKVVDGEGKVQWEAKLTSQLSAPPVVVQDKVIVRTADTRITVFSAVTGEQEWTYQRTQPALTVRVPTAMSVFGSLLLVGQPNGQVVLIEIQTGRPVFEFAIAQPKGITEVERLVDVVGAPTVNQDLLCASSYQGAVTCVNSTNGQPLWSQKVDAVAGPAIDDDNVYIVETDGIVKAFYRGSGEPRWTNETMIYRGLTAPVAVPGAVAVGDNEGYVHFLSPRTGEEIARVSLSGAIVVPAQSYRDGAIFQTDNGEVVYLATQ